MEDPRQEPVNIVLDGACVSGKSAWMNHLKTGRYEIVFGPNNCVHKVMINQVEYVANIWDTNGAKQSFPLNTEFYKIADVLIEFFDISSLRSLEETIDIRIPYIRRRYPKTPILLVGTKADLRGEKNHDIPLFPVELGPFLAKCLGAVKYMECSAKANSNVHEVLEEAVHCFLNKSTAFSDVQHDLYMTPDEFSVLGIDILRLFLHAFRGTIFNPLPERPPRPTCTLWYIHGALFSTDSRHTVHCRLFNDSESQENVVCSKCPANFPFPCIANDCKSISSFFVSARNQLEIRKLVIVNCTGTLDFSFLAKLTGLEYLVIVNTDIDLATLTFPAHLQDTIKHLELNNCGITQATDVPFEIGKLANLQILNLANNNFKKIPTTLGFLDQLHTLLIDQDNVLFPPRDVFKRPLREIISYLRALKEYPVANTETKLIVVGQEKVGKSTLVKAMKRRRWLMKNEPPPKTDGVDISKLTLQDIQCKVYDLAGDVEYLNTHSLFLSSNSLHLVVFDLSRVIVDKGVRSTDHLCRLELWLETIASRDPKSKVILVGTHADHSLVNEEILNNNRSLLVKVLMKYCSSHRSLRRIDLCEECFICNLKQCPETLECLGQLTETPDGKKSADVPSTSTSQIPHILGYLEVSSIKKYPRSFGFHNVNVEKVKSLASSSISNIMKSTGTDQIPKQWLLFRETIAQKLLSDDVLKDEPLMPLSRVHDIALELEIHKEERMIAMLRFFHCQGMYLWYEDLPEMRDIVILDPQWLSDQLRTLISYHPSVSTICDRGVLHLSELSTVWGQMSEDNRRNLLALFRSVGLCFSISDTEELFPCNLPVGWPDREIWPPVPKRGENQTSLLFRFSFVPPSFFPDLTVEVNKKNETFARNVKPLYYRFHIIYIRRDTSLGAAGKDNESTTGGNDACLSAQYSEDGASDVDVKGKNPEESAACTSTQNPPELHTIHFELMPYNNSLIVTVRGSDPPSIIPDIRSTIETVRGRRYPGITFSEKMLCPECVMKRVQPPASFKYDVPHDGVCPKNHKVGTNQTILQGRYSSTEIVPSSIAQTVRVVGETLEDHFCPKLFVVLPINLEGLSLKDRFVYSYIRDGFAVHLLCECPGQWHFVDSPGFRVGKPKEFFDKYGSRVCKALRFISTLSTPLKAAALLDPHCKAVAAVGAGAKSVSQDLQSLLDSYLDKYPHLKSTLDSSKDDLKGLKSSSGLQRSELSRFLEVEAKGHNFGPLVCTYVDKRDEWLWLCEEHNERFEIVKHENEND